MQRFLKTNNPGLRQFKRDVLTPLQDIGHVGIVGGLVRDVIRYGIDDRPVSDIDLVVQGSPSAVAAIAKKISAQPNRFGGYGLKTDHFKVDFWALSTTWARVHANVHIAAMRDILDSTFFNWDAVVYSITENRTYFRNSYLDDLENGILEINLGKTASHLGNLIRALRRLISWQATPGPKLTSFVGASRSLYAWTAIVEQEQRAFPVSYLSEFKSFDDYLERYRATAGSMYDRNQALLFSADNLPKTHLRESTAWTRLEKARAILESDPVQLELSLVSKSD